MLLLTFTGVTDPDPRRAITVIITSTVDATVIPSPASVTNTHVVWRLTALAIDALMEAAN